MKHRRTIDWVNTPTEREWLEFQERQKQERIDKALAAIIFPLAIALGIVICATTPMWMR